MKGCLDCAGTVVSLFIVVVLTSACGNHSTRTQQAAEATPVAAPQTHRPQVASNAERRKMREWWETMVGVLLRTMDSVNGISSELSEHPSSEGNSNYMTPDKVPADWHQPAPTGWTDVVDRLATVVASANEAADAIDAGKQGNEDEIRHAGEADRRMKEELCAALATARSHYATAGGEPGDLRFSYMAEWSDPPCTLIPQESKPATIGRSTVLYDSSDTWEGDQQMHSTPLPAMLEDGHAVRVDAGTSVILRESRNANLNAMEDGVGRQCRVSYHGKDWWVGCSALSLVP